MASSSKANCTAIVAGGQCIIVDAGIPRKEIIGRLSEMDVLNEEHPKPDCLLVSHGHSDHTKYVHQWTQGNAPIITTSGTAKECKLSNNEFRPFNPMHPMRFGKATFSAIPVSHDAAQPVAWRIASGGAAAIVATDLGVIPEGFELFCAGATDLLLEANYHKRLLATCKYLEPLKQRIAGDLGHLDVETVCEWLKHKLPASVNNLYLGHLSKEANDPQIVRHLAGVALLGRDVELVVLEG